MEPELGWTDSRTLKFIDLLRLTAPAHTTTRAQLLPRMADRTRAVRLCLHRLCVEYLATGNFYLLA